MAFICKRRKSVSNFIFYIEHECKRELWDLYLRTRGYFRNLPSILKGDSLGEDRRNGGDIAKFVADTS